MTDIERGRQAVTYFHNASLGFSEYGGRSLSDLLALYGKKADIYLEGIGLAIHVNGLSDSKVKTAMIALANNSRGRIPKDHQAFIAALGNEAAKVSYLDLSATVAKDVVVSVAEGAQAVGDNVIGTLKILNFVWPFALLFFLWTWYGSKLKKAKR